MSDTEFLQREHFISLVVAQSSLLSSSELSFFAECTLTASRQGTLRHSEIELDVAFVYLGRFAPIPRMQRLLRIFVGPELYWVLLYAGVRWLAERNVPPSATGNTTLEWAVWLSATVAVALSFAFLAVPATADASASLTVRDVTLHNYAVSPPHSAVTARAYCGTRRAIGRAGYRGR